MMGAIKGGIKYKKRSGGTTISQQLARSLIIKDYHKTLRRKILEIPLGLWIDRIYDKKFLIKMYLANVRFDYQIFGIRDAYVYYFNKEYNPEKLSKAEAFVLVERIANINKKINKFRIDALVNKLIQHEIIEENDKKEIDFLYKKLVKMSKLFPLQT